MDIENLLTQEYFENDSGLSSWLPHIGPELSRPYICHLRRFLESERIDCAASTDKAIYPEVEDIFSALRATPIDKVRAVIVGQDPYHGGQADGFAFSMSTAPSSWDQSSLRTILKAVNTDFCSQIPLDGSRCNLIGWASEGVLLLNSVLSVRNGCPNSHSHNGWEQLTDRIIEAVGQHTRGIVFLLWGKKAKRKRIMVDLNRGHRILYAPHPSSRSARKDFVEAKLFSTTNDHLQRGGIGTICWTAGLLD